MSSAYEDAMQGQEQPQFMLGAANEKIIRLDYFSVSLKCDPSLPEYKDRLNCVINAVHDLAKSLVVNVSGGNYLEESLACLRQCMDAARHGLVEESEMQDRAKLWEAHDKEAAV